MDNVIQLLFTGLGLGFAVVASPGAVTMQSIRTGLHQGFSAALSLQFGAIVGLAIWAIVAFAGTSFITQSSGVRLTLGIIGSSLLLYLSWDAIRSSVTDVTQPSE